MDEKNKNAASFKAALRRYQSARAHMPGAKERRFDQALRRVDLALDNLMNVPSPSLAAFGQKIGILNKEYGLNAQPRHIGAIYADVALLAVLYADVIYQALPGS